MDLTEQFLEANGLYDKIIVDGSPRTLHQYGRLKDFFAKHGKSINCAIYINISDGEAIKRLSARRFDTKTGRIYNLITNPPGLEVDKELLMQRKDDTPEAIKVRLMVQKVPDDLLNALKKDGILIEIDGERSIDMIFKEILVKLRIKDGKPSKN